MDLDEESNEEQSNHSFIQTIDLTQDNEDDCYGFYLIYSNQNQRRNIRQEHVKQKKNEMKKYLKV